MLVSRKEKQENSELEVQFNRLTGEFVYTDSSLNDESFEYDIHEMNEEIYSDSDFA